MKKPMSRFFLAAGPGALAMCCLLIPGGTMGFAARAAVGLVLWMALWWTGRPVGIAVTAMLPVAVNALMGLMEMGPVVSQYASEIVVLLLGADLVTITWRETGLDRRISLRALCFMGASMRQQVAVWFVVSAGLSMFLPNSVVCAVLTPIAVSMLAYLGEKDFSRSRPAVILLSIAWGAGIGGCGSPLGGAMNLVAISYIEELSGREFMYAQWIVRMLPFLAVMAVIDILYLSSRKIQGGRFRGSREYFRRLYGELPSMGRGEKRSLVLFLSTAALAFARPLFAQLIPAAKPAYIFLIGGLLAFLIRDGGGKPLLTWEKAEKEVMWGMLLLFAGGLAAGRLITGTGAAAALAGEILALSLDGGMGTVAILVFFTCLLAEVSSNTAAAAISVPMVVSITQSLGLDPLPFLYITAAAFNSAYVLPISIRAIPAGYGMDTGFMMRHGVVLALLGGGDVTLTGTLLLPLL